MYHFIPFEEIDKNKWNGAIHYAPNGNVYGYYWYLKAVVREWDAIVEDDYESVMPVFRTPLKKEQYQLLPELGPYSVNYLNTSRVQSMLELAEEHNQATSYPINRGVAQSTIRHNKWGKTSFALFHAKPSYEEIFSNYKDEVKEVIQSQNKDNIQLISGLQPEAIVALANIPHDQKNTLMRIMYNAMHRGIGFSTGVKEKVTEKITTLGFYIFSHNTLYEIFQLPSAPPHHKYIATDLLIRNQAGKHIEIISYKNLESLTKMGFLEEVIHTLQLGHLSFRHIRKWLDLAY